MSLYDDEQREAILGAVRRTVEAMTAAAGGANLSGSLNPLLPSGSLAEATIVPGFGTGYNGTETTVPFTSDISVLDATTLQSEDIVTM